VVVVVVASCPYLAQSFIYTEIKANEERAVSRVE
jgi:hypothetical protein